MSAVLSLQGLTVALPRGADRPEALRVVGEMEGSDEIMNTALFLGTYPGITNEILEAEIAVINNFCCCQK